MVLLQLCRWTFLHKKLCSKLYSIELEFYLHKRQIRLLSHTSSVARWKARGRLPLYDNWTFFARSCSWDLISRYWSKMAFCKGVGHFKRQFQVEGDIFHRLMLVAKKQWISFHVVSKYRQYVLSYCHKARVWRTDRRTELQSLRPR